MCTYAYEVRECIYISSEAVGLSEELQIVIYLTDILYCVYSAKNKLNKLLSVSSGYSFDTVLLKEAAQSVWKCGFRRKPHFT